MPGAHSDVGGSYHDLTDAEKSQETFTLYRSFPKAVKQDARQLIEEGWYRLEHHNGIEQIFYKEWRPDRYHPLLARIQANRSAITNAYCRIPLKLMAKHAREQLVPINYAELELTSNEIIEPYPELIELDQNLYQYITTNMAHYNRCAPLLVKIRNRHLHMSAKEVPGMGPRFKGRGANRQRHRHIYNG